MRTCLRSSSGSTSLFLQGHQRVATPSSILTIALQFLAQYNTFGLIEGGDRKLGKMCTTHNTQQSCRHVTYRKTPCLERNNYNVSYTSSTRPYRGSCTRRLMRVSRSSAMRDDWMYSSPCLRYLKRESDQKNEKEVNRIEPPRQARLVHSLRPAMWRDHQVTINRGCLARWDVLMGWRICLRRSRRGIGRVRMGMVGRRRKSRTQMR